MKERLEILPSLSISQSFYIKVVRAFRKGLSITKVYDTIGKKQKYSRSNIVSIRNYAIKQGELEKDPSIVASWATKKKNGKQLKMFSASDFKKETVKEETQVASQPAPEVTKQATEQVDVEENTKGVFLSTAEYNTKRRSETTNILTIDFKGILVQIENSSNIIVTEDRITVK